MNVSELFELTNWIQNEIVNKQIPQKYSLENWSFSYVNATNTYHHLITDERAF